MLYCHKFFKHFNFEPKSILPCCDIRGVGVPSFPFAGGGLDIESYATHILTVFKELQTGAGYCKGCPELTVMPEALPGSFVATFEFNSISINHHRYFCNCRCIYCDLWHPKNAANAQQPYSLLPTLKQLESNRLLASNCAISWGGGEPTILDEFEEASTWLMEAGYFQYVHTNALQVSPALAKVLSAGKGRINVSLDSFDVASYRRVKGVEGWKAVVASLEQYMDAAIAPGQIDLKYIIFDATNDTKNIERFFHFCLRLGITQVQYSHNYAEVNSKTLSEKTLLATAFFRVRSQQLGLVAEPFYIDPPMLKKIAEYERRFLS